MKKMHVKKGDTVVVLWGEEKGKTGKVMQVSPKSGLVLVEGVGFKKKHQRPRKEGQKGQIIDKHLPIRGSKVMSVEVVKERGSKRKPARSGKKSSTDK